MGFLSLLAAFSLVFSFLAAKPSASSRLNNRGAEYAVRDSKLTLPLLSRKLKLHEESTVNQKDFVPQKTLTAASSGNKPDEKEENVMHAPSEAGKGTWREWVEGPNKSEYFTMDYGWVRRRRPIHNKQIPNFVP